MSNSTAQKIRRPWSSLLSEVRSRRSSTTTPTKTKKRPDTPSPRSRGPYRKPGSPAPVSTAAPETDSSADVLEQQGTRTDADDKDQNEPPCTFPLVMSSNWLGLVLILAIPVALLATAFVSMSSGIESYGLIFGVVLIAIMPVAQWIGRSSVTLDQHGLIIRGHFSQRFIAYDAINFVRHALPDPYNPAYRVKLMLVSGENVELRTNRNEPPENGSRPEPTYDEDAVGASLAVKIRERRSMHLRARR